MAPFVVHAGENDAWFRTWNRGTCRAHLSTWVRATKSLVAERRRARNPSVPAPAMRLALGPLEANVVSARSASQPGACARLARCLQRAPSGGDRARLVSPGHIPARAPYRKSAGAVPSRVRSQVPLVAAPRRQALWRRPRRGERRSAARSVAALLHVVHELFPSIRVNFGLFHGDCVDVRTPGQRALTEGVDNSPYCGCRLRQSRNF